MKRLTNSNDNPCFYCDYRDACSRIREAHPQVCSKRERYDRLAAIMEIDEAPAADVALVVRCRDCKYHKPIDYCKKHKQIGWFSDSFCSQGQRKEN